MLLDHGRLSPLIVGLTVALAGLQLFWAGFRATSGFTVGAAAALGVLTFAAAVLLARSRSFDSRLAVAVVTGVQLGLMLLAVVLGLPGQHRHPLDRQAVVAIGLPALIIGLLLLDARVRRRRSPEDPDSSSYAL